LNFTVTKLAAADTLTQEGLKAPFGWRTSVWAPMGAPEPRSKSPQAKLYLARVRRSALVLDWVIGLFVE
jgi:hypothetical protein